MPIPYAPGLTLTSGAPLAQSVIVTLNRTLIAPPHTVDTVDVPMAIGDVIAALSPLYNYTVNAVALGGDAITDPGDQTIIYYGENSYRLKAIAALVQNSNFGAAN